MDSWRTTFKRNWLYMLTGTLISVFLWVAVSADTVGQQTLPVDLLVGNNDRRYVLTEQDPTDEVSVVFTGREGDLALLSLSRPQILVSIDTVPAADIEIPLTANMVQSRGGRELVDVRALSVRPNRLSLHFEPRSRKQVPVVPVVRVTPARGFALADSPRVEPSAVTLDGPAIWVNSIDTLFTLSIEREGVRETLNVEAPLEIDPDADVEMTPGRVRVRVAVEPAAERSFPGVPVNLVGVDSGYRVEPPVVDLRVWGPRSAVNALRAGELVPRVDVRGPVEGSLRLPVFLSLPSAFLTVEVVPDSALVVPNESNRF